SHGNAVVGANFEALNGSADLARPCSGVAAMATMDTTAMARRPRMVLFIFRCLLLHGRQLAVMRAQIGGTKQRGLLIGSSPIIRPPRGKLNGKTVPLRCGGWSQQGSRTW